MVGFSSAEMRGRGLELEYSSFTRPNERLPEGEGGSEIEQNNTTFVHSMKTTYSRIDHSSPFIPRSGW